MLDLEYMKKCREAQKRLWGEVTYTSAVASALIDLAVALLNSHHKSMLLCYEEQQRQISRNPSDAQRMVQSELLAAAYLTYLENSPETQDV